MLSARHFTFPLAARTSVASNAIVISTAPTHRAITQHHDVSIVGVHAVQKPCLSQIKSVSNHDLMPYNREHHRARSTGAAKTRLRVPRRLCKPARAARPVNWRPAKMLANNFAEGTPRDVTSNSFASVSLDPPLILWSLKRSSTSLHVFDGAERFVVNVLAADQVSESQIFSRSGTDKFANVELVRSFHGAPVLKATAAVFECERTACHDGGDHVIFVGKVDRNPLVRSRPGRECEPRSTGHASCRPASCARGTAIAQSHSTS
jgi:flavin reductase (DIM6/NTAB) family NADH-FMN oxidoreductase RutF